MTERDDDFGVVLSEDEAAEDPGARGGKKQEEQEEQQRLGHECGEEMSAEAVGLQLEPQFTVQAVPEKCIGVPCRVGIDEAGRGPVIGPMMYGLCYWPVSEDDAICKLGFNDSKQLSEAEREKMLALLEKEEARIGRVLCTMPAEYISTSMLLRGPISLNELSYRAAIEMVRRIVAQGVDVAEIFVDAVGDCDRYTERLRREFPSASITVKPKADALFKVVGAASIYAKVERDRSLGSWVFREQFSASGKLLPRHRKFDRLECSGYPGDPKTIQWLEKNGDRVFGFPSVVRHSWKPTRKLYGENVEGLDEDTAAQAKRARESTEQEDPTKQLFVQVEWEDLESQAEQGGATAKLSTFLTSVKRHKFFSDLRLVTASSLH